MITPQPNESTLQEYQEKIKTVFWDLKQINRYDDLLARSIRLSDNKGYLLCISELFADDDDLISSLTKWRSEAITFQDTFQPTFESTKKWIRKYLLDVPDRILFLVLNRHGHAIGHLGYANSLNDRRLMEVDNVIRGVKNTEQGIMSYGMKALINWAGLFSPQGLYLRTLEENTHAVDFYKTLGFDISAKIPLRRIEKNGEVKFIPRTDDDKNSPDRTTVYMEYTLPGSTAFNKTAN